MAEPLFFAHANGFPSEVYGKLFDSWAPGYQVAHLGMHGHNPRYPVSDNWPALVDELVEHLRRQPGPVWGVGHSLGGGLHLHAALRHPELYRGLVLLDSPLLTTLDRWLVRAAKRLGLIDRITPAGRTLGRRERFENLSAARAYFSGKALFSRFDLDCLEAYLAHGLCEEGSGLRLRFDAATEIAIYRGVPHRLPAPMASLRVPLALVQGALSRVVLPHHGWHARRLALGEFHRVPGGHMFPFEHPLATAELVRSILTHWEGRGR